MSTPTLAEHRQWVAVGTQLCDDALTRLTDEQYAEPSGLPGWSRAHVVAHLAANAKALRNLTHWAATGEETPMYPTLAHRNADIDAGSALPPPELRAWFDEQAHALAADFERLTSQQWQASVRTAQGRTIPGSQIPWLRAREVLVHAVDLGTGITFADVPDEFLIALEVDIRGKRGADTPEIQGSLADRVGYLAGRTTAGVTTPAGAPAPDLTPWL